jgi:hypothetical protein
LTARMFTIILLTIFLLGWKKQLKSEIIIKINKWQGLYFSVSPMMM